MKRSFIALLCAVLLGCGTSQNPTWLTQAFGDYVRSVEGQGNVKQVAALIIQGRNKWLPAGHQWDMLAAKVIDEYVKANPQNDAEMNKALEELAMQLNTNTVK